LNSFFLHDALDAISQRLLYLVERCYIFVVYLIATICYSEELFGVCFGCSY